MRRYKPMTMRLFCLVAVLSVVVMSVVTGDKVEARSVSRGVRGEEGKPRDLFDQMLHSLASKYFPGYRGALGGDSFSSSGAPLQWSVHPLPRKRQLNLSPSSSAEDDNTPSSASSLSGLLGGGGGGGGNAIPASVLAAAAVNTPSASASGSATQPSATAGSNSDRSSASAAPSASASNSSPSTSPPASSAAAPSSAVPLSKLITASSSSPSSSTNTASRTSTTATPTPTSTSDSSKSPWLLSPKHKMFPLVVAGLAAAGLLALMLLIAIARCIAHDQLRRDNLRKSYAFDDGAPAKRGSGDRFTSGPPGMAAARSLRRAMTKKKQLGSFARRTQDGSVLIEVGDEVFAVPAHLADSYREKILREKRSASDLTAVSEGGLFGNVKPKYLNDGGPDGGDEEQARAAYDNMLEGGAGVRRSLSQRLGDRLRSLTTATPAPLAAVQERPMAERNAFSFHSQHQQNGAIRQSNLAARAPVVTTGGAGWAIQQRQASLTAPPPLAQPKPSTRRETTEQTTHGTARVYERTSAPPRRPPLQAPAKTQPRKAAPKLELSLLAEKLADLEKQSHASSSPSSARSKLPVEARLTRLPSSGAGTFGGSHTSVSDASELSVPGAFPQRTKSLHRTKSVKPLLLTPTADVGSYRHRPAAARAKTQLQPRSALERKHSSVALASPTRFTGDNTAPRVVVHPERPQPAATLRPLPVPPPFTLPK
ncbi:hypothetical protein EX895_006335 [Sporisorium graminicola]|uniref:Uncharacterized protein n=1 Tax=Sporisorium graminicola TaxID=280036 RepID=A0A4U7KLR7_9BASI|nr:hypothetical protein EX895_006335 [Sporisorium graminicola]TKY85255.1 hypothetical protein EX895_006335 [Sporisorium graminicola]